MPVLVVNVGAIGNVLSYQVTGLTGGDNVAITVTPTGSAGTCFSAATATCTANACTPPTASISYTSPFCGNIATPQSVTLTGTGAYTGGTYSALPAGLTIAANGSITPGTSTAGTYTVTYTVAASGGCPGVTATASVTIAAVITPTFTPVAASVQEQHLPHCPRHHSMVLQEHGPGSVTIQQQRPIPLPRQQVSVQQHHINCNR